MGSDGDTDTDVSREDVYVLERVIVEEENVIEDCSR